MTAIFFLGFASACAGAAIGLALAALFLGKKSERMLAELDRDGLL